MNKAIHYLQSYLLFALPVVLAIVVWGQMNGGGNGELGPVRWLWEAGSWALILWFIALILFLLALFFYPPVREQTIRRLSRIQERDEREEQITGRAARASYISTLALVIFLFFISVFKVELTPIQTATGTPATNSKTESKTLSIGFGFEIFDTAAKPAPAGSLSPASAPAPYFASTDLPLSKPALLLLILLWQLASFRWNIRRQL